MQKDTTIGCAGNPRRSEPRTQDDNPVMNRRDFGVADFKYRALYAQWGKWT